MIIEILKEYGNSLVIDTDTIKDVKESGVGYDITFGDNTYYFSINDAKFMLNKLGIY